MIRAVREWSEVPIVVLSARDREIEKIEALDLGADDFVNKPFGVGELHGARCGPRFAIACSNRTRSPILRLGDLEIDNVRHRVTRGGSELKLTPEGIRAAAVSGAACRARADAQAHPHRRLGPGAYARTRNICGSMSGTCARRSNSTRKTRGSSSPNRAWDIGLPRSDRGAPGAARPGHLHQREVATCISGGSPSAAAPQC